MVHRRFLFAALISAFALVFHINVPAQSHDQSEVDKRQTPAPSAEDQAKFAEFLKQPDTGLTRLIPRDMYKGKVMFHDLEYYSFTRVTHGHDIEIQAIPVDEYTPPLIREYTFHTGHGFITVIGNVPLEKVTLDHKGVKFLDAYTSPPTAAELREEQRRSRRGIDKNGYGYNKYAQVTGDFTYALRSINYGQSDVLVAFRVVRKDFDGNVVILWKILKRFPAPPLFR